MDERRDLVHREELRRAVVKAFADHFPMAAYDRLNRAADAVLAVPAIADALARDAQVAEIVAEVEGRVKDRAQAEAAAIVSFGQIATMYAARATSPSPVNVPAPCERVARCGDYRPFSGPDTYATISGNRPDYDPGV